jgi:hypothetical protein
MLPIIVAGTDLRPEEWPALERCDNHLREYGKTDGSLRAVLLRARVAEALDAMPRQLHSPLVFPGPPGHYLDYNGWRRRHLTPAVRAAG